MFVVRLFLFNLQGCALCRRPLCPRGVATFLFKFVSCQQSIYHHNCYLLWSCSFRMALLSVLVSPGCMPARFGGTLGMVWGDPAGRPWGILEEPWVKLDVPGGALGSPGKAQGSPGVAWGNPGDALGCPGGRPRGTLEELWVALDVPGGDLGRRRAEGTPKREGEEHHWGRT